jgi:uncharacterized LabA/DUF88 family protein
MNSFENVHNPARCSPVRIGLFIDGADLFSIRRLIGLDIDYHKFLDFFRARGRLVRAYYYTTLIDEPRYARLRSQFEWMSYNGYSVVTKPALEITDDFGRRHLRNRMDVELATDMIEMSLYLDHIVLVSGAGELCPAVAAVQRRGVRVTLISTMGARPPLLDPELHRQVDALEDLRTMAPAILRDRPPSPCLPSTPES